MVERDSKRRVTRGALRMRHRSFEQVSPEIGQIDDEALAKLLAEDPDAAAALLADMSMAVDDGLRRLARELAASTFIRLAAETGKRRGPHRLTQTPPDRGGDVDVDRTLDKSGGLKPRSLEQVVTRAWSANRAQVVLLVDRSGSMSGAAVARAAIAAAALALAAVGRADCGVVAFARHRLVLNPLGQEIRPAELVDSMLKLRGHGTTDVASALSEAASQLARAPLGSQRVVVLLSDCLTTEGPDPLRALSGIDRLHVVVPDAQHLPLALRLAQPSGGKVEVASTVSEVARAVSSLLA